MSTPRPWMIAETNWKQVRDTPYEVVVLPWGATEAHNWHLPYGTDSYQNEAICARAGSMAWEQGAKVGILPNIPFGVQTGQSDIPFCINMNPSTQFMVLSDIVASLAGVGISKVVIFNGHGGNDFKQMLRELQIKWPQVFLSTVFWANIDAGLDIFEAAGDHADEKETSMMLYMHPDLVLPRAEWGDGKTRAWRLHAVREKWAWAQRSWTQVTDDTGSGNPELASAEKGELYVRRLTEKFAGYLVELAAADIAALYEG